MKKRIAVLGATGSIGKSTLDVVRRGIDNFKVVLLSAHSNLHELETLKTLFPSAVCILTGSARQHGKDELLSAIKDLCPDITLNGIAGSAGLEPSIASIACGSSLALANKETIVMAGHLAMRLAKEKKVNIIPVDSEHSAVFHLLQAHGKPEEIILTASGGPFRKMNLEEMENATAEDALAHPTWNMGKKITIDSASMANKGLEIIEACVLFNMPPDKIKVVIHPQSIVHSMVRTCNGAIYAQLSKPDMRHPIHDALYWPEKKPSIFEPLNFDSLTLEFEKPDLQKFPMLTLAWEAAKCGGLYPCAYNAANEAAVASFLEEKIKFTDIPKITEHVLQADWNGDCSDIQGILQADTNARRRASEFIDHALQKNKAY
jgi:1-deoxy-D-xylulose-5-phosphate reductoisomerase